MKITVLGAGNWGTAFARILSKNKHEIVIWTIEEDVFRDINENHVNTKYLKGVNLPESIRAERDLGSAVSKADFIVMAVPSHIVSIVSKQLAEFYKNQPIIDLAKGFEPNIFLRMSETIKKEIPSADVIALSGPSIANEVALDIPTSVSIAGDNKETLKLAKEILESENFHVFPNNDIIGVEMGGILKNVIAIAGGMSDGLGFGCNTKSAIITNGLKEMKRIGVSLGAKEETFFELSGIGDLIVTSISEDGRNRTLGEKLGRGMTLEEIKKESLQVMEGVNACSLAIKIADEKKISVPITREIYDVLFNNKKPISAVRKILSL